MRVFLASFTFTYLSFLNKFEYLAPEAPFFHRVVLGNPWLFSRLVIAAVSSDLTARTLFSTSQSVTTITVRLSFAS